MAGSRSRSLGALVEEVQARAPGLISNAAALIKADAQTQISSITQDSRAVVPGGLFGAIRGYAADGHDYVDAAVSAGAVAVLVESERSLAGASSDVVQIISADTARATGYLAAALFGQPSERGSLVAVTGTNGKTSVVTILAHLVNNCGRVAASMGTLTGSLTTAAAPDFQASLDSHFTDGATVVAAEVSSHALDQQRIAGSKVAVAIFTNLSQDHLDYHADMDEYFEAKARLFSDDFAADHVIDVSDPYGAKLAERLGHDGSAGRALIKVDGNAIAEAGTLKQGSSTFTWRDREIALPLGGSFSVNNAVMAAEAAVLLGCTEDAVATALASVPAVPGRFESVDAGQPFAVVIDYSHTPASVAAAVQSARQLTSGSVILVFGAAGDRDPGKRPLMGRAAAAADRLYVTSDNPRTEDPAKIIDEVVAGIPTHGEIHVVTDRAQAISQAISGAGPEDIVVIAGKGHEDYQIVGTTRTHFDDREEALRALRARGWDVSA